MINVHGIHAAVGAQGVEPVAGAAAANQASAPLATNDVVEISTAAKLAARVSEIPDVRTELVEQVKAQIAAGTYETPERIDAAINKLMDELFPNV